MGAGGEHSGHVDGGFKSERLVDEGDVVVDGLGDGDDADGEPAPRRLLGDVVSASRRAVAADAEEKVDVHSRESIDHYRGILRTAGTAEDGSAGFVDVIGVCVIEQERFEFVVRIETAIAVPDAVNQRHSVLRTQGAGEKFDDIIEAGAQSAGGENGRFGPGRIVVDFRPGAGLFKCRNLLAVPEVLSQKVRIGIIGHRGIVGNEFNLLDRGGDRRVVEPGNLKIFCFHRK